MKIDQPRPRTAARVAAVQALFQAEQGPENPETVIDQFVRHRFAPGAYEDGLVSDPHAKLFGRIVRAAAEQQETLDALLAEALPPEWPLARLDPVLRALLRAAGAELATRDGAPAKVVINEYLDVAHGFFDGDEPKMANGLLDRMARTLRPKEF
jgi:N utilization substance protein B